MIKTTDYYDRHIKGAGHLGEDFKSYYGGEIKMGDTPSLLYLMQGNPEDPTGESWGGSFEPISRSARVVYDRMTTLADTVAFCSVLEFRLKGPEIKVPADSAVFWMEVPYGNSKQIWPGYYLGNGNYVINYAPKQAEILRYQITSKIPGFPVQAGELVVSNRWPGKPNDTDYLLGPNWYSDSSDPDRYDGKLQGGKTILKWRNEVLTDWAKRWEWLRVE